MASKKITELPLITGISGSVGYGQYDYRSVIPVVVGGSTNQITVEDFSIYAVRHSATTQSNTFLGNQTITGNISVSGTSTLTGNTSVGGTFGVTGNTSLSGDASVGGNLVVAGRITAEEFHTEITTASVIYASGSTKFGDTIDDKHEITGSTDISGSLTVRGNVLLNGTTFDISQLNAYTQSLKNEVGTIEAYTASVKETISQTLTYTQSLKETISQTLAYTGSVKETISQTLAYTASVKNQLSGIEAYTASIKGAVLPNGTNLDVFGNLRVSGSTYFGDNASDSTIVTGKVEVTGSLSSTGGNTADFIQLSLTPSGVSGTGKLIWDSNTGGVIVGGNVTANGFTGSFQSTNGAISASAQITELPSIQQATASLAAFTGSIRAELGNVEAYTASVKETISQTLAYTQSLKETISQTLAYTASVKAEIGNIESYTASLKETITQTLAYTASVKNEVGGLEAFTASIRTELGNVEAYTASVKETISQTLAYTASVKAEIGNIEAYTASLKNAIVVNGTNVEVLGTLSAQQIHTTYTTSSVLYQSGSTKFGDTVDDTHQFTGSVDVSSNIVGRANVQANKFIFTDGVVSETTTTQKVIGTSGNILYLYTGASGLYINNQANNAQNVTITDAGVVTTRGGVQIGSSGNDQSLTFGGTNSSIYWGVGGPARMYYNVGDIKISSAGATDVLTVQNIGGVSVSGGITGSLLSTNGVVSGSSQITELTQIAPILAYTASLKTSGIVSSSQQIQNYNTFALDADVVKLTSSQTLSGVNKIDNDFLLKNIIGSPASAAGYTSIRGYSTTSSNKGISFIDTTLNGASLLFDNTSNYVYTFPSSSGTIALTSNLSSYLPLTGGTLTGTLKTTGSLDISGSANIFGGNFGLGTTNPDFGSFGAGEKILGISNTGARARVQFQNSSTGTSGVAGTLAFFNGSTQLGSLDVIADGATNKGYYAFNANNGTSNAERVRIDSATLTSNVPINTNNNTIYSSYSTPANVNNGNTTVYTYNQTSGEYCVGFEYSIMSLYAPSGTNLFGIAHGFAFFMADGSTNSSYKSATAENGWSVAVAATNGGTFTITFTAGGGATHTNINLRVRKINRTGAG